MRVTFRELVRRPGRFLPVGGAMTLLVVLLVVLGGFLDGLAMDQTGVFRSQDDRLWVLSEDAELQLARSRIDAATADQVAAVDGVGEVGGLASFASTAAVGDGERGTEELIDVVVVGYELSAATLPEPPLPDEVIVDERLRAYTEIQAGDVVSVGPTAVALQVADLVPDATQGGPSLWVALDTWRALAAEAAPTSALPTGTVESLVVTVADGADPDAVADAIDEATGATRTVDLATLIDGQPVVAQQTATFEGIIVITLAVVLLVVALFFALLVLERIRLYAVLKAIGGRSLDLVAGVMAQAVVVSLAAFALGTAIALAFVAILPADLPVRLVPTRIAIILAGTVVTAVLGVLVVLRRILRIQPAQAIS